MDRAGDLLEAVVPAHLVGRASTAHRRRSVAGTVAHPPGPAGMVAHRAGAAVPDPGATPAHRQPAGPGGLPLYVWTPDGPGRVVETWGRTARVRLNDVPGLHASGERSGRYRVVSWPERTYALRSLSPHYPE